MERRDNKLSHRRQRKRDCCACESVKAREQRLARARTRCPALPDGRDTLAATQQWRQAVEMSEEIEIRLHLLRLVQQHIVLKLALVIVATISIL